MNGTIKSLVGNKRFGFIKSGENEYFFHQTDFNGFWNDLETDFKQKQEIKVTFEPDKTEKELRARNVKREDWPN